MFDTLLRLLLLKSLKKNNLTNKIIKQRTKPTEDINKIHINLHYSVLPVFAQAPFGHVTPGSMSPSCPFSFVWPSDSLCPLTDSQGAGEIPAAAAAAPPGRCLPRGSCRRNWRCLVETFSFLLGRMKMQRSDGEEEPEDGSCIRTGWGGRGVGRWAQPWYWCCGCC